ncbi:MAG: GTPase Era [Candidatus Magnetoovum sp. WYHC-5]|nr:GTPase Era [Candidatus Magnetoovum sp. WYHC-5]
MSDYSKNKEKVYHSGYVSIIGKPNVGKSTLLNRLIGQTLSIVTDKPQTTRNTIMGVQSSDTGQIIFMDTPGIYSPKDALGDIIVKAAVNSLGNVDIVYFMVNPVKPDKHDLSIIDILRNAGKHIFLVINKIDRVKHETLLSVIATYSQIYDFQSVLLISAKNGDGVYDLINKTMELLPVGPKYYPEDFLTDRLERLLVEDIIRGKIMELTSAELPHAVSVEITRWIEKRNGLIFISANIYIEKESQKGIIIGKKGQLIKAVGIRARQECEHILNTRVYVELFVKVKKNWRKDINALRELGFA